jgi:hypothetical protein
MTLPSSDVTEVPAGASLAPSTSARSVVTFGCSNRGIALTPRAVGSTLSPLTSTFGCGPGVKACAYVQTQTGADAIFIRLPPTAVPAFKSAVTKIAAGSSVVTLTGTPLDGFDVVITITTGGTVGTSASYTLSTDGGKTTSAITSLGVATTLVLAGTGITVNFGSGTLTTAGTITFYTLPASQAVLPLTTVRAASSTSVVTETTAAPEDAYEVRFEVQNGGTIGVAGITFRYSLDGGITFSASTALGTASSFALLDGAELAGLTLAFAAGTLDTGDVVTFNTTAPEWQASDALAALATLRASALKWSFLHAVGVVDTSKAGSVGGTIATWAAKSKFSWCAGSVRDWGTHEAPLNWIANLVATWATFADTRIALGAGMGRITCPITGRSNRRSVTWTAVARTVGVAPQTDIAQKDLGPLSSDVTIHDVNAQLVEHDARVNSTLHDNRFITYRTWDDEPGVFFSRGNLMGPAGDIQRIAYRRVLNIVDEVYQKAMREQIERPFRRWGARVKLPFKVGDIHEADAMRIQQQIQTALRTQVVETGMVSSIVATLARTPISTGQGTWRIECDVKIVGLAYIDNALGRVGFVDPVLDAILNKAG